jgi:hypothetical protein
MPGSNKPSSLFDDFNMRGADPSKIRDPPRTNKFLLLPKLHENWIL